MSGGKRREIWREGGGGQKRNGEKKETTYSLKKQEYFGCRH